MPGKQNQEPEESAEFTPDDLPPELKAQNDEVTLDEEEEQIARSFASIQASMIEAKRKDLSKAKAEAALEQLKTALAGLDDAGFRQVMANTDLQDALQAVSKTAGTKPGDPLYDQKGRQIGNVPYTYADFCEIYPMVDWIPPETVRLEINGVALQLYEGMPHRTPSIFHDHYQDVVRRRRYASRHKETALHEAGAADGMTLDVGWRKDEVTANTPGWHEV